MTSENSDDKHRGPNIRPGVRGRATSVGYERNPRNTPQTEEPIPSELDATPVPETANYVDGSIDEVTHVDERY